MKGSRLKYKKRLQKNKHERALLSKEYASYSGDIQIVSFSTRFLIQNRRIQIDKQVTKLLKSRETIIKNLKKGDSE